MDIDMVIYLRKGTWKLEAGSQWRTGTHPGEECKAAVEGVNGGDYRAMMNLVRG